MSATRFTSAPLERIQKRQRWSQFARDLYERCFAHQPRKPQSLYDVRAHKTAPFFAQHADDYARELAKGANADALLDAHAAVGVEIEGYLADDASRIPGKAFMDTHEAFLNEFTVECESNPLQILAAEDNASLSTLIAARHASIREMRALLQFVRSLDRRIAAKEQLSTRVS